ncbi:MAG: hypothetical protein AB7T49_17625 [Oligoflexales bacterium]
MILSVISYLLVSTNGEVSSKILFVRHKDSMESLNCNAWQGSSGTTSYICKIRKHLSHAGVSIDSVYGDGYVFSQIIDNK